MPIKRNEGGSWGPDRHTQEMALNGYTERVAQRLKAARESRGLTLRDVARITTDIEVSGSTIRNYEMSPTYRQVGLGVVQAIAMVLEYDLRALLCLSPFDSDDDAADLARAELEPTCEGSCHLLGDDAPEGCKVWEIIEHYPDLSLVVIRDADGPRVSASTERFVVPCDAEGAYEHLTIALNLEEGLISPDDVGNIDTDKLPKPRVTRWNVGNRARQMKGMAHAAPEPLHRRRDAREGDALAELGPGWEYRESDGERCPFLVTDDHHDVELRGFSLEYGATCEVSLWRVPDMSNPGRASEAGIVTGVPCNHASVETAVAHLSDQAPDTGTLRLTFRSLPGQA